MEYILILVIVVGIILSVMYQLNTAFKKYVQSYFGEYVACLLETGELPSLGAGDGASAEICNASFEPFSLANGRPLAGGGGGGSGERSAADRARRANSGSRSGSAYGGRGYNGPKVTRGMNARNAENTSGNGSSSSNNDKKRSVKKPPSARTEEISFRRRRMRAEGQLPVSGYFKMMDGKEKETAKISKRVDAKGKRGGSQARNKKMEINMDNFRKTASTDINVNMGLSFGEYMRYILIAGLIIMIVIFFGGQLLTLKKSWEKE